MTVTHTFTYTTNRPDPGRHVHYVQRGSSDGRYPRRCAPALVLETQTGRDGDVDDTASPLAVNLNVWAPTGGQFPQLGVPHALPDHAGPASTEPGSWHWHTECPSHTPPVEIRVP